MPLLAAVDTPSDLRLCQSSIISLQKIFPILEYEIPFVFDILGPDFVLNMRHINRLSLSLETSNIA